MIVRIAIKVALICLVTLVGAITVINFEGSQAHLLIVGLAFICALIILTTSITHDMKEDLKEKLKGKEE